MKNQVEGIIKKKFDTNVVSDKFKKREFWLEISGTYPQTIPVELTQENVTKLDEYSVGDSVVVFYNFKGNIWNSPNGERCFLSIQAWKLEKDNTSAQHDYASKANDNSDLPF